MGDEHEKAYGEGKADREAGKPDRTQPDGLQDAVGAITGLNNLPPQGPTEVDQSYQAGYNGEDKK